MKSIFLFILFALQSFLINSQPVSKKDVPSRHYVSFAGKTDGEISKAELLNAKSLVINKEDADAYHISSFKMTIICHNRDPIELENNKNGEFSTRMIEQLKNVEIGCKLFFEFIRITDNRDPYEPYKFSLPLNFVIK